MEVSPKTLREVEFREKMRGYHPEDVDQFLEQVAAGIEVLQDRLRQAVDRAQRAEAAASESGGTDETLRKTLVLAQRTADMAVQEAREQAARILGSAEQQAQAILAEAEDRGRRTLEETIAECKAELSRLEANRAQGQMEVETLQRWLDEHKEHLRVTLTEALAAVDRAGVLWPAPTTRPLDSSLRRSVPEPAGTGYNPSGSEFAGEPNDRPSTGEDTVLWSPEDSETPAAPSPLPEPVAPAPGLATPGAVIPAVATDRPADAPSNPPMGANPPGSMMPAPETGGLSHDDQALDDFFEDNGDYDDDRRFGSRLRRRR